MAIGESNDQIAPLDSCAFEFNELQLYDINIAWFTLPSGSIYITTLPSGAVNETTLPSGAVVNETLKIKQKSCPKCHLGHGKQHCVKSITILKILGL